MKYQIKNAIIGYPGHVLLDRVSLEVRNQEKIALVGRNGCGKTTLLKVIAGLHGTENLDSDEEFSVIKEGNLRIGYLEQMAFSDETQTVREALLTVFARVFQLEAEMELLVKQMEENASQAVLREYGRLSEEFEALGGYTCKSDMEHIFTRFGFLADDLERELSTFSGGQKTRIAFVRLLLSRPDILLLDEPTNHLDMGTIEWLEGYIKNYGKAVIMVSHDRMFIDNTADVIYEIEHKHMKRYPGNYTAFVKQKREAYEKQKKDYEAQKKEIERLTALVEKFKNKPTKVAMTRSKLKQIEHMEKIPKPEKYDLKTFHAAFKPRLSGVKDMLAVNKLTIGYDRPLCQVSFQLEKGQKLAVIGDNGKGKSTLLKTLVGRAPALSGSFRYGADTEIGYFDQELAVFSGNKSVIDEFWDAYPKLTQTQVRTALGNFLFTGDDVFKSLDKLSGGERVRLALCKLMKSQPNLLILDEPTNHLDMVGKEALESMLKDYEGTLLFVSHDRYFVKEIGTALLVYEGSGVSYYPYGYEEYLAKKTEPVRMETNVTMRTPEKKKAVNPGKEKSRKEQRLLKLEREIEDKEALVKKLKLKYTDPEIAADFEKLAEIDSSIKEAEGELEAFLMEWAGLV